MDYIARYIFVFFIAFLSNDLFSINASITHSVYASGQDSYVEIYTRFIAKDIQFSLDNQNQNHADLEVLMYISQNSQLILGDKYTIKSPSGPAKDFWDLKRYNLPFGQYDLYIEIKNVNNPDDPIFKFDKQININKLPGIIALSDPLFLADVSKESTSLPFQKHGVYYEPLAFNFIAPEQNILSFYIEVSRIKESWNEAFFVKYEVYEGLPDALEKKVLTGSKKLEAEDYTPLFLDINVEDYCTGNYTLVLTAGDRTLNTLDQKTSVFSVFKPIACLKKQSNYNTDYENSFVQMKSVSELNYGLKAIFPSVGNDMTEVLNFVIDSDDIKSKKYFLYAYWAQIAPEGPEQIYNKYMEVVKAVDIKFNNNVGKGFETDRGYIFLKYGKPNDVIAVDDEPNAPPYEIWVYNFLPASNQSNVKFIFYNPSLSHNDFELLHSTCRGERSNPQWEVQLYSDTPNEVNDNTIDATTVSENWNRNARRYFEEN